MRQAGEKGLWFRMEGNCAEQRSGTSSKTQADGIPDLVGDMDGFWVNLVSRSELESHSESLYLIPFDSLSFTTPSCVFTTHRLIASVISLEIRDKQ